MIMGPVLARPPAAASDEGPHPGAEGPPPVTVGTTKSWKPEIVAHTGKYRTRTRQPSEVGEKYKIAPTKSKLHRVQILVFTLRQPARREAGSRRFDLFT